MWLNVLCWASAHIGRLPWGPLVAAWACRTQWQAGVTGWRCLKFPEAMAPAPHRSPRTEWQETGLAQAADNALNSAGWRHHTSRGESVSWPDWSPRRIILKFLSIFLLKNVWNLKYIFLPLRFLSPLGFCWSWWPFLFSQSHLQHLCVSWCPWRKSVKPVEWVWLYVNKRNHCVYSNLFK